MKHVIYHTEYYDNKGTFLREEENDAYFNTLPADMTRDIRKAVMECETLFNGQSDDIAPTEVHNKPSNNERGTSTLPRSFLPQIFSILFLF